MAWDLQAHPKLEDYSNIKMSIVLMVIVKMMIINSNNTNNGTNEVLVWSFEPKSVP